MESHTHRPPDDVLRAREALIRAGLSLQRTSHEPPPRPLPPAQRAELAQRVRGRPLSEMIIEDREQRA